MDDSLSRSDIDLNSSQLAEAKSKVLAFLREYDFKQYTTEDFAKKLGEANKYGVLYIQSTYHPAEGPGRSREWGYTSGSSAYYSYSKCRGTVSLELKELDQSELVVSILKTFDDYQHVASNIDQYKEKRAAVRSEDLSTFRAVEEFLVGTQISEDFFRNHKPQTFADIVLAQASVYIEEPITVDRAGVLVFAANLKGFKKIRTLFSSVKTRLQAAFNDAVEEVFNHTSSRTRRASPKTRCPDITESYIKNGLIQPEIGTKIQQAVQKTIETVDRYDAALENLEGMPQENLRPIINNIEALRADATETITGKFAKALLWSLEAA